MASKKFVKADWNFEGCVLKKADLQLGYARILYKLDGQENAFYASAAYHGDEAEKFASPWHEWTVGERFMVPSRLVQFEVDMTDVYVIDTVDDFIAAVRLASSPVEIEYSYVLERNVKRVELYAAKLLKLTGAKALYYTDSIARELHTSDTYIGDGVYAGNLNALDTDQIMIVDPSIIDMDSVEDITQRYRDKGVLHGELEPDEW